MKWCCVTKDNATLVTVNKTKDIASIKEYNDVLKFIHKKNPNKGKFSSIKLFGPYKSAKNVFVWVIYYELPVNKNHESTLWKLYIDNTKIDVYDGAIIIHTQECANNVPVLSTCIDVNTECTSFVKTCTQEHNDDMNDDIDDVEDIEDVDEADNSVCHEEKDDKDEYEDDADNIDYDDEIDKEQGEIDLTEPSLVVKKDLSITLEDDIRIGTKNLEYEKYDYDASVIPSSLT